MIIPGGQWHHAVDTFSSSVWKVYIDGQLESQIGTATFGNFTGLNDKMQIGRTYNGTTYVNYHKGCIKEVSIWGVVKTAEEIANAYANYNGYSGSETGIKGYWKINEGSGTAYDDATSASTTYNMTTTGTPTWTSDAMLNYYTADVQSYSDYDPGGMLLPGRNGGTDYRYGFNGMEEDDEIKGDGNSYDFGARIYDPRIGRWLSVDPMERKFPSLSPYIAFDNNPIFYSDPNGSEATMPWPPPGVLDPYAHNLLYGFFIEKQSDYGKLNLAELKDGQTQVFNSTVSGTISVEIAANGDYKDGHDIGGDQITSGILGVGEANRFTTITRDGDIYTETVVDKTTVVILDDDKVVGTYQLISTYHNVYKYDGEGNVDLVSSSSSSTYGWINYAETSGDVKELVTESKAINEFAWGVRKGKDHYANIPDDHAEKVKKGIENLKNRAKRTIFRNNKDN